VGLVGLDGGTIDTALLQQLTDFLAFRGPDAQHVWSGGLIGFGHTLLRATHEASNEEQPVSLNGIVCVADARVDGRADLIKKLGAKGCLISPGIGDCELILHAYSVWGTACVEHLIGDFVFAIWDGKEQLLFCARDQFGVKPFFYAHVRDTNLLIFSNTLDCIRRHPAVSSRLNDLAIADFLLFDMGRDPRTTTFTDIQRLPAAHVLLCRNGNVSIRQYWELPVAAPVHYKKPDDYVERFRELLDAAVSDRLRVQSAAVLTSGGLDSPTVAASACRLLASDNDVPRLFAYTEVLDGLMPHEERHYASFVAKALKIPIEFTLSDNVRLFGSAADPLYHSPEPAHSAWPNTSVDQLRQAAATSRAVLTGFGADPAFCSQITVHFRQLLGKKEYVRVLADAARYLLVQGRLSRLYLRTRWQILFASKRQESWYPGWLGEDLEKRLDLRDRWETMKQAPPAVAAVRPGGYEAISSPIWQNLFEGYDAGFTRIPVEVRHPFFDLRLLNFLLALPALPWCSDKQLLREAARGVLPKSVRLRRKSPLRADPIVTLLQRPESAWVDRFEPVPELEQYVLRERIPVVFREKDPWTAWIHLRPLSLNFWLRSIK
jgi:asparagine synthase (glutamine-hydrolysing)